MIKGALLPLVDRILVSFIFGSLVRGNESSSSDLDVMVVGNVAFAHIVSILSPIQEVLIREINPIVYPPEEFQAKLKKDNHFLKMIMEGPKIFLIGDQNELEKLAE